MSLKWVQSAVRTFRRPRRLRPGPSVTSFIRNSASTILAFFTRASAPRLWLASLSIILRSAASSKDPATGDRRRAVSVAFS